MCILVSLVCSRNMDTEGSRYKATNCFQNKVLQKAPQDKLKGKGHERSGQKEAVKGEHHR